MEISFWMVILNKINTRGVLVRRGILGINDAMCPLCMSTFVELVDHLTIHCHYRWSIWLKLIEWWGLSWCCPGNLSDLFKQWEFLVHGEFQRKVWSMLFFAIPWSTWILRNGSRHCILPSHIVH